MSPIYFRKGHIISQHNFRFYKFLLVFEPFMCQHYVSSLVWSVLRTNLVPVVFGEIINNQSQHQHNLQKNQIKTNYPGKSQGKFQNFSYLSHSVSARQSFSTSLIMFRWSQLLKVVTAWFLHWCLESITKKSRSFSPIFGQKWGTVQQLSSSNID